MCLIFINLFTGTCTQGACKIFTTFYHRYPHHKNNISIIISIILISSLTAKILSLALTNGKIVLRNVLKVLHFKEREILFQAVISRKHDV